MKNKFMKKAEDQGLTPKKKRKWPYIVGALFAIGLIGNIMDPEGVERQQEERAAASSSRQKAKEEEKKKAEASASSEDNKKEWTAESGKQFAEYLNNEFVTALADQNYSVRVQSDFAHLVDIYVPQEFKYESNGAIQQMADSVLGAKNRLFNTWAVENGYDLSDSGIFAPKLTIKAEDGSVIAEESTWSGEMKRKVDN